MISELLVHVNKNNEGYHKKLQKQAAGENEDGDGTEEFEFDYFEDLKKE